MRSYYEQYSVEWDSVQIEKMTRELINFDILFEGEPVGVIRLSFDDDCCHLRDLQVDERYQGRGIGSQALAQAEKLAREEKVNTLRLKVFKSSPQFGYISVTVLARVAKMTVFTIWFALFVDSTT